MNTYADVLPSLLGDTASASSPGTAGHPAVQVLGWDKVLRIENAATSRGPAKSRSRRASELVPPP